MGIKRLVTGLLLLCLLASPALAVKKTLLFVDSDTYAYTGWQKTCVGGIVSFYGGELEYVYCLADDDTIANTLARAVASGDYGLVILCVDNAFNWRGAGDVHGQHYGNSLDKYWNLDENPIGIPQLILSRLSLQYYSYGGKICMPGVDDTMGTEVAWNDGAVGSGCMWDSLWAETSAGDTMLWWHGTNSSPFKKQIPDDSDGNTGDYHWVPDVWVKGNENNWLLWHGQPSESSTGTDTVMYFLPQFQGSESVAFDAPIKALCALLKKFDCIEYVPFYVSMDDYAFIFPSRGSDEDHFADSSAALFNWCEDNGIYMNVFTMRWEAPDIYPAYMATWANSDYIKFGWGADAIYRNGTQNVHYIFTDWGDGANETCDSLRIKLQWDYDYLTSEGWHQYMDNKDFFTFARTNHSGADNYNLTDSILAALACTGVRKFRFSTSVHGHYHIGGGVGYRSIFYPHKNVPIDMSIVGGTGTAYCDFIAWNYEDNCGGDIAADWPAIDSSLAAPSCRSDSLNMRTSPAIKFYRYFPTQILGNGRLPDGDTDTWGSYEDWPNVYNVESRGISFFSHYDDTYWSYNGTAYNTFLEWLKHYWNNMNAYNNLAGAQVFRPMLMEKVPQRWSDEF